MAKKTRLRSNVEEWCESESIVIPGGFYRHPTSRYGIAKKKANEWRLVATTWYRVSDAIYYLSKFVEKNRYRVMDFDLMIEKEYLGGATLGNKKNAT